MYTLIEVDIGCHIRAAHEPALYVLLHTSVQRYVYDLLCSMMTQTRFVLLIKDAPCGDKCLSPDPARRTKDEDASDKDKKAVTSVTRVSRAL